MIGIFLHEILPVSARPGVAGVLPQGNKHILNEEAGKKWFYPGHTAKARLSKAWFLRQVLCCWAATVLRMVPGIRVGEANQAGLSEAPHAVLKSLAKCPVYKCLINLPGCFEGAITSEQQQHAWRSSEAEEASCST